MARVTLVLPDELARELRMKAVEVYGGEKGWLGKAVTDAIKDKYPGAELVSATKDTDDDGVTYDVTIKYKKQELDVTLTPEGADASKRLRPQRQTTDARGEFAFRVPAEPGRYRVTASAKRFQMQEKTVEIRGEERTDVTLTLAESSKR